LCWRRATSAARRSASEGEWWTTGAGFGSAAGAAAVAQAAADTDKRAIQRGNRDMGCFLLARFNAA
jgi:hypothetical protein